MPAQQQDVAPSYRMEFEGKAYQIILPNPHVDHIQKQIVQSGQPYERDMIADMLSRYVPGTTVFDVGANIGNHTLSLAAHGASVIAFEPDASLSGNITASAELNSFADRVAVQSVGVGAKSSFGILTGGDDSNRGTQKIKLTEDGGITIISLDDLDFEGRVSILKVDVEGMERQVLDGAARLILSQRPIIYAEASDRETLESLIEWSQEAGYAPVDIFNVTPTICFMPMAQVDSHDAYAALLRRVSVDFEKVQSGWRKQKAAATRHDTLTRKINLVKKKLESESQKHGIKDRKLSKKNTRPNKENTRLKKRLRRTRKIGLIIGLPVLLLLSPVLALYFIGRAIKKRTALPMLGERKREDASAVTTDPQPLVSIIIPAYNVAEHLEDALQSALAQDYENLEIVVVDDGSSDNTLTIATSIAASDHRIRVVPLIRNFGCYFARNSGVLACKGSYIGFLDADDRIAFNRISLQIEAILKTDGAIGSRCQQRRWTDDFAAPVGEMKFGENSLLLERSVYDRLGFFDCVRYAGDSEFRERVQTVYGRTAIVDVEAELSFLRSTKGSLTMSGNSVAYMQNGEQLSQLLSPAREGYRENYRNWHTDIKWYGESPRIDFVQRTRSFELGAQDQNASPFLGERVIGKMATFPDREEVLKQTVSRILPQVDELHVYLNQYDYVPAFLLVAGVVPILGKDHAGDLRDNGKFFQIEASNGYLITFDDDIFYPYDYVARMLAEVEKFNRKAVVGVHGVVFPEEKKRYTEDRTVLLFNEKWGPHICDLLGTGTVAFHSSTLSLSLSDFGMPGICDLWFAVACHKQGVPLVVIDREKNWLTETKRTTGEVRLYDEALLMDDFHTKLYHEELYPILSQCRPRVAAEANLIALSGETAFCAHGMAR